MCTCTPCVACVQYILGVFCAFGDIMSTSLDVQYILVNTMSTLGGYHEYIRGYYEYILSVQYISVFNINFKRLLSISSLHVSCPMYLIHPAVLT